MRASFWDRDLKLETLHKTAPKARPHKFGPVHRERIARKGRYPADRDRYPGLGIRYPLSNGTKAGRGGEMSRSGYLIPRSGNDNPANLGDNPGRDKIIKFRTHARARAADCDDRAARAEHGGPMMCSARRQWLRNRAGRIIQPQMDTLDGAL